nr:hypothetical protein [Angustibacter aerolatus]
MTHHGTAHHLRPHRPLTVRRVLHLAALVLLGVLGAGLGAALSPAAHAEVGPLRVQVHVRPSLHPGVAVALPPVGSVRFDTHLSPVEGRASIESVDVDAARRVIDSPTQARRAWRARHPTRCGRRPRGRRWACWGAHCWAPRCCWPWPRGAGGERSAGWRSGWGCRW